MSTVLSYGFVKPSNGDYGTTFFPQLAANIQQTNDHSHNGINSAILSSIAINPTSASISHNNWSSQGNGTYRQLVTTPPSITFDSYGMAFRITSATDIGTEIHPTIVKVTSTTYYVYVNDSNLDLTVLYFV